jgi:hypothetical protein
LSFNADPSKTELINSKEYYQTKILTVKKIVTFGNTIKKFDVIINRQQEVKSLKG